MYLPCRNRKLKVDVAVRIPDIEANHQGHALIIGVGADLPNTVDDAIALVDTLNASARCGYPPN